MFHGDLHIGNILINDDKQKFVIIDFERCVSHKAFVDIEEKKLLCRMEKLYLFRFFFRLGPNTCIESHKLVHGLFVEYFKDQWEKPPDDDWEVLTLPLSMYGTNPDSYSQCILEKEFCLNTILEKECFQHNGQKLCFHKYLRQKRFKQCIIHTFNK